MIDLHKGTKLLNLDERAGKVCLMHMVSRYIPKYMKLQDKVDEDHYNALDDRGNAMVVSVDSIMSGKLKVVEAQEKAVGQLKE